MGNEIAAVDLRCDFNPDHTARGGRGMARQEYLAGKGPAFGETEKGRVKDVAVRGIEGQLPPVQASQPVRDGLPRGSWGSSPGVEAHLERPAWLERGLHGLRS